MNHKTEEWFQKKLAPWLKKDRLMILLLSGILLLVISLPSGKQKRTEESYGERTEGDLALDDLGEDGSEILAGTWEDGELLSDAFYLEQMEKELEELLGQVDGAGRVKVMLTLEQSAELVVLTDVKETQRQTEESGTGEAGKKGRETIREESTIYDETSKGKSPYVVKKRYPQVQGVVVIAQGAGTGRVSKELAEAVQALFGLEAHKIKVLKLGLSR